MSLTTKINSEPFLSRNPHQKSSQSIPSRSSLNLKLPNMTSKSPVLTKSDRLLFNSQFSHLPAGAVVMFPPRLKEKEGCINYFTKNTIDITDPSILMPGKKEAYDRIRKTMCYEEVVRIVDTSKRTQSNQLLAHRKKGSMYLSELWTKKQTLKVIKKAEELNKAYDDSKEIEREGLPTRLKKLEDLYGKRKDMNGDLEMMDISKIMQDFQNQGINSPALRFHNNRKKTPLKVRTETSILDTLEEEIQGNTEKAKKVVPSLLDIPSSIYDGNTNDTVRSKSRSNLSIRIQEGGKLKVMLPKLSGTLTDLVLGESIQDAESQRHLFNTSPGQSRIDICPSYPIIEGHDLLSSAREKSKERGESKVIGLETIREIARGGKENKENSGVRNVKNAMLSSRSHKSYDGTLKQKIELPRTKEIGLSQDKELKERSYKNGRKNMWVSMKRSENKRSCN